MKKFRPLTTTNTSIRATIPNLLTLCNLLCGCVGIWFLFTSHPGLAGIMVFIAALFDVLDGLMARCLNATSDLGVQLDSLSDVVSFGVLPSFMAFDMMIRSQDFAWKGWAFLAFLMALCSAYRLAKFNIDTTQKESFSGLPTPMNAIFWAALCLYQVQSELELHVYYVAVLSVMFSILMICPWRMFSLKSKDWSWNARKFFYLYILLCILSVSAFGFLGICIAVVFYPVFSFAHYHIGNNIVASREGTLSDNLK